MFLTHDFLPFERHFSEFGFSEENEEKLLFPALPEKNPKFKYTFFLLQFLQISACPETEDYSF